MMKDKKTLSERPYAFTVCRIEPENNLHLILKAFETPPRKVPELVIVGNWNKSVYGRDLKALFGRFDHIHLLEPIYDLVRLNRLRSNCKVYLHGHSCGGTNPSLVEAMYMGLPIFAFDVNFNRETTERQAKYFSTAAELHELCENLDAEAAREVARKMKEIADRRYTWERISELYAELF